MRHHLRAFAAGSLLAIVLALAPLFGSGSVSAQTPCRFVMGFAELVATLGPAVVGACLEDQRTITGSETFDLGGTRLTLPPGTAVQRTANGILTWSPAANRAAFRDAWGERYVGADGAFIARSWDEIAAQAAPAAPAVPAPAASAPTARTALRDAEETCDSMYSSAIIASVSGTEAQRERRKADAEAISYLCDKALEENGPRGVTCFVEAWDAATGMERVFAGSGMKVYDEKYRACLATR